jgi:hypothetical protein
MGWLPFETVKCTNWEFWAAWLGWSRFNCAPSKPAPITHAEIDAILREYGGPDEWGTRKALNPA